MADHSKPSVTSSYANYTAEIDARFDDLAVGLDPAVTTATNLPTNSLRWSSAAGKWQKWNGSSWGNLTSTYNISISGSAGSVEWVNVANKPSSLVQSDGNTYNLSVSGSAASLTNARTINGVSFNGTANINVNTVTSCTFNNSGTGSASGITFDGSSARTVSYNTIGAPSVAGANATGTWGISISGSSATCTGNASTASTLQTARNINGVSFNGSADVTVEPYVETDSTNANRYLTFVDVNSNGYQRLNSGAAVYNPSTNTLNCKVDWSNVTSKPSGLVLIAEYTTPYLGEGFNGQKLYDISVPNDKVVQTIEITVPYYVGYSGNLSGTSYWGFTYFASPLTTMSGFMKRTPSGKSVQVAIVNTWDGAAIWPNNYVIKIWGMA